MSNSVTLLASQVPAIMIPSTAYMILDALNGGYAPHAEQFQLGEDNAATLASYLNAYGMRIDLLGRYPAPANCICYGLEISAGTGLTLNISDGLAVIDAGFVEQNATADPLTAALTETLTNNSANYVWWKTDGTIEVKTTTAQPSSQAVYLGYALTAAGAITQLDDAGRLLLKSGIIERQTADTGEPADSPNASWRGWTVTSGGRYWWTGTGYERLGPGDSVKILIPAGRNDVIPAGSQKAIIADALTVRGSLAVRGHLVVRA